MKTVISFQDLDVVVYEADSWNYDPHKHAFYEIVYILEGNGFHLLNNNKYKYQKSSLYLLSPSDTHSFDIEIKTQFCIIPFNSHFFSDNDKSLFHQFEATLINHNDFLNDLKFSDIDNELIAKLILKLLSEKNEETRPNLLLAQNILLLILNLISNTIQMTISQKMGAEKPRNELYELLLYIQQNIYNKEKLSSESIANHFCKSETYINDFFKKHTQQSLKKYITQYKLNLIQNKLTNSKLSISQIADEFGFTDESHLNKVFKQHFAQTASEFRKLNYFKLFTIP